MTAGKVLIVDDDPQLLFVLKSHLSTAGFEVKTAANGREAVDRAKRWRPDVIVTDIAMPVMDGLAATRALQACPETRHIPVIMLTAKTASDDLLMSFEAGAMEFVAKPFSMTELLARVRTVYKLSRTRAELDRLNGQLADEVENKTRRLELLYDFARALNEANSRDDILDLVINTVRQATGCKRISVMLRDASGEQLTCARALGIEPQIAARIRVGCEDGVAGRVFSTGKTFVARTFADLPPDDRRYHSDSFLSTPLVSTSLMTRGESIGVLNATDKENGEPFTREEIDCLRSVADSAAIALNNQMRRQRLEESVNVLIRTVGRLAEYRDEETTEHLVRVQEYTRTLALELARRPKYKGTITEQFVAELYRAAPLHDLGKVGIPDHVLTKPAALSATELAVMRRHTEIGKETLEVALADTGPSPLLQMCLDLAYCHHERYDGNGYPRGLVGEETPLAARILALADAYDAITSRRCYKDPIDHAAAVGLIRAESGKQFDPDVVDAFLQTVDTFDAIRRANTGAAELPEAVSA